jgi:cytochrome P450
VAFLPTIVMKIDPVPKQFHHGPPHPRHHVSAGLGLHHCFGNRLAETQHINLWDAILKRFPVIELMDEPKRI